MLNWRQIIITSLFIVLMTAHWHTPHQLLLSGWWVEQHRPPDWPCEIVTVKRTIHLPPWLAYLNAFRQDRRALLWILLAIIGTLYIWLWQRTMTIYADEWPTDQPLCLRTSWQTNHTQAMTGQVVVLVSAIPSVAALPAPEARELLPSGGEPSADQVALEQSSSSPTRKRNSQLEASAAGPPARGQQRICVPIDRDTYEQMVSDKKAFRQQLDELIATYPTLFPSSIQAGYTLDGWRPASKKMPEVRLRRIKLKERPSEGCGVYTIAPAYVLPYMRGYSDEVEPALFLRRFGVPFWALTRLFGHNDMYWYRLERSLGRNSVVGTTVSAADKLPQDVLADEKHTRINGHKCYIAMTGAGDCIFGAAVSLTADTVGLSQAYGHFQHEARYLSPTYAPQTVNLDGWKATIKSWQQLFETITPVLCFLHAFIKIRDRGKKQPFFDELSQRVWDVYHAPDKATFQSRMADLRQWAKETLPAGATREAVQKLCEREAAYLRAYDHPTAYRTSTRLDQQMDLLDRYLFSTKYFHGHRASADLGVRAWALMHNFQPYCPRSKAAESGYQSPAHRLNGRVYDTCWLQNLLISASMAGYRV